MVGVYVGGILVAGAFTFGPGLGAYLSTISTVRENPFATAAGVSVEIGGAVDAASVPVDAERVAEIRAALQDGSYPLVPTKIADAMIAAQVSFSVPVKA